jgi:hypothetical protein
MTPIRHTSATLRSSRAALSPVLRRATQDALTRSRVNARLAAARSAALPTSDSLTPATPSLGERWWDPHLVDRLQTPLTRFRD